MAPWVQVPLQLVKKERPFLRPPPPILFADPVKIDREGRHEVELPTEVRQRFERTDRPDAALDTKQIEQLGKQRERIDVQAETGVSELLQDEEKKTAAA